MSEPVAGTEPAEEKVQEEVEAKQVKEEVDAKQVQEEVEVKQETSTATEEVQQANGDSSTAMEVEDSSHKESNLESAGDEDGKPFRRNGASRKRFKWLIDQGYSRNAAAQISKTPFKPKDMREKYIAETGFFKEKIDELSEVGWESLDDATKRRVKWLIKNGYAEEDALRLASEPSLKPVVSKRNQPTNNGGPTAKRASEAAELLVMAVVATDFPKTLMTKAQTDEFKSAILKEVVQQKDSELKPHFKKCVHVNGYLRVQCSDQETRRWLQQTVAKLAGPEGITIKVVAEKNLLKGDVYTGHFPDSRNDTNETILEFIESQNDGISTSGWTILTRKEVRDTETIELMFTVDQESAKSILSIGYELNYKFNTVKLRKKIQLGNSTEKGPNPNQRRTFNQPSSSFVPILDSNFPANRGGNNFNPFSGRGRGAKSYRGGGFNNRGRGMSNGNRPFDMVDTLYDQLRLISGGGSNPNQWGGNTGFNSNRAPRNYNGQGNRNFSSRSGFY